MNYDNKNPLIFIHIPKCAGPSVRRLFLAWFKGQFYTHYFNEAKQQLDIKISEDTLLNTKGSCVFGHFNKCRGFGVLDSYPNVTQFMTIMRDPYDQFVSEYFYKGGQDIHFAPSNLAFEDYLEKKKPNYLNHFPVEVTFENYKNIIDNQFIFVGVFEELDNSLKRIADVLPKKYVSGSVPKLKIGSEKPDWVHEYRDLFNAEYKLEKAVYDYAFAKFKECK